MRASKRRAMRGLIGEPPARRSRMQRSNSAGGLPLSRYPVAPASIASMT